MRRIAASIFLLLPLLASGGSATQEIKFQDVKVHRHRSASDRVLIDKLGVLMFDDTSGKIRFKGESKERIEVAYGDVTRVVFEVTRRMRSGLAADLGASPIFASPLGTALAAWHVSDYWFYVGYRDGEKDESILFEVPKRVSARVIEKAESLFGERVTVTEFTEKSAAVKLEDLKAFNSKQEVEVNKQNHPLPEVKPDKATVVVACPPLAPRYAGKGNQFKVHANDQIVAVNRQGTYSFIYLDPGRYRLVSQSENADGFEMQLEAGHQYFFLQNTFIGAFRAETKLTRNSRELVMYLVDGLYFSEWKAKEK